MPLTYRKKYRVKTHRVYPRKKKLVKQIKAVVNRASETKMVRTYAAFADLEAASQRIVNISKLDQGNTPYQRDGNVVSPISIHGKIAFRNTAVGKSASETQIRVMLVKYKQCDGTLPTLAEILPDASGALDHLCVDLPLADTTGNLPQNRRKFQIVYDKFLTLPYMTGTDHNLKVLKLNKKLSGKIYFTSTGETDEGNNQYILMIHTNAADDTIEEAHDIRLFFKDG